jgi:hypothetical protein
MISASSGQNTQRREGSIYEEVLGKFKNFTTMPLVCAKDPRKIWEPAIGSLGGRRQSSPESGEASGGTSRGSGGVRLGSHRWSDGGQNRGWGSVGEGARQCRGSAAAAAVIPVWDSTTRAMSNMSMFCERVWSRGEAAVGAMTLGRGSPLC